MLILATALLSFFVFRALLSDTDVDDDNDGPGGGMMIPATVPTS